MARHDKRKAPSQRQLRVGEEIRHGIAEIIIRNEMHEPALETVSVTVSEVRISPDLKNASVYVAPLVGGDEGSEPLIKRLNVIAPAIRNLLNKKIVLKYSPKLFFKLDKSFEEANKINMLLKDPRVARDLAANDSDDSDSEMT